MDEIYSCLSGSAEIAVVCRATSRTTWPTSTVSNAGTLTHMHHPFAEHIDLAVEEQLAGSSKLSLVVKASHLNPHGVVHGAIAYAMADTGMGAALYPTLSAGQICATIEIKINYFKPIVSGRLVCVTELVNRGKSVANLTSKIYVDDKLVALANGNYAIFAPGPLGT